MLQPWVVVTPRTCPVSPMAGLIPTRPGSTEAQSTSTAASEATGAGGRGWSTAPAAPGTSPGSRSATGLTVASPGRGRWWGGRGGAGRREASTSTTAPAPAPSSLALPSWCALRQAGTTPHLTAPVSQPRPTLCLSNSSFLLQLDLRRSASSARRLPRPGRL